MNARWMTLLVVLGGGAGCKPCNEHGTRKAEPQAVPRDPGEWQRTVNADKAKRAVLVDPGQEPRRVLAEREVAVGKPLVAAVEVTTTTKIQRDGRDPMTSTSNIHGVIQVSMRERVGDAHAGQFEVTKLEGDLKRMDTLPRKGTFEPGGFGEPWSVVVHGVGPANEQLIWQRDLSGWVRTVLVPVPQVPIGIGASWSRAWDDYLAGDKVTELREYKLVALDATTATISIKATTSASTGAGASASSTTGTLTLPLGPRAVPTLEVEGQGAGSIHDGRGTLHIESRSKISIRPQPN